MASLNIASFFCFECELVHTSKQFSLLYGAADRFLEVAADGPVGPELLNLGPEPL